MSEFTNHSVSWNYRAWRWDCAAGRAESPMSQFCGLVDVLAVLVEYQLASVAHIGTGGSPAGKV